MLIVDVRHTRHYAATLRDAGLDARCVQGIVSYLLSVITFGSVQFGYVIGSEAGSGQQAGKSPAIQSYSIAWTAVEALAPVASTPTACTL